MPRLGLCHALTLLVGFVLLVVLVSLSLSFWHGLGVFIIGMVLLSLYGSIARQLEAQDRFRAAETLTSKGEDRSWFFVGWDDHLLYSEARNRPDGPRDAQMLYALGYNARRDRAWRTAGR